MYIIFRYAKQRKKMNNNELEEPGHITVFFISAFMIILGFVILIAVLFGLAFTYRHYSVWSMEMQGKAKLAEATQSRQIQVEQAKAELDAAKDIAKAITIVGEVAKKYPEYRKQMYIQAFAEAMTDDNNRIQQIIYIPTEAGIPILEAKRGQ